ncbi:DUF962 domain-containing protein [Cesiribacter sp. SM1]|uniref:DUF962 domain-containing protein n=1 Tax=Cesiribacter sp. SM1 TaxID=2861196 RepID=UPI001CD1A178|nr:DUF962 domain-containing protein [Cesiribacter sp. SM1]
MAKKSVPQFNSLGEFYPYYLQEHLNPVSRRLHFIGTGLVIMVLVLALITQTWWLLWLMPLLGYGFAWVGHTFFERNKPATFTYPFYSLASYFLLFRDLLIGKEKFNPQQ